MYADRPIRKYTCFVTVGIKLPQLFKKYLFSSLYFGVSTPDSNPENQARLNLMLKSEFGVNLTTVFTFCRFVVLSFLTTRQDLFDESLRPVTTMIGNLSYVIFVLDKL